MTAPATTPASVELGILRHYGMHAIANELLLRCADVDRRLGRSARAAARRLFGAASSYGGGVPALQFALAVVCGTAVIAVSLLSVRHDSEHRAHDLVPDAVSLIATGIVALALGLIALRVGRRVVDRAVFVVSARVSAIYAIGAAAAGVAWARDLVALSTLLAVAGIAAASALLALSFALRRRRDPRAAAVVDAARSTVTREYLPHLQREREAVRAYLRGAFAERADTQAIIDDRNATLARSSLALPDPQALPGESVIDAQTVHWMRSGQSWRGVQR